MSEQSNQEKINLLKIWQQELKDWSVHYENSMNSFIIIAWVMWSLNMFLIFLIQIFKVFTSQVVFSNTVSVLTVTLLSLNAINGIINPNQKATLNDNLRDTCIKLIDDIGYQLASNSEIKTEFVDSIKLSRQTILSSNQPQVPTLS